jgi:hypothetical protein
MNIVLWITTIVKISTALFGILTTIFYLVFGLVKKDNSKFKKAGLTFVITISLFVLIALVEFVMILYSAKR